MFRKILAVEILAIFFKWGILIDFIHVVHQVDFTILNGLGAQTYKGGLGNLLEISKPHEDIMMKRLVSECRNSIFQHSG